MSDTKERLIEVATNLFLGKGYGAVGTSEICTASGVNKGTFYHFFSTKSDLLIAAMERYATTFADGFQEVAASSNSPAAKLQALFEVPLKANRKWKKDRGSAQGCLVGNMALELGAVDIPVQKAAQKALDSWASSIVPIIHEYRVASGLQTLDAKIASQMIVGLIQGGLLLAKTHNNPEKIRMMGVGVEGMLHSLAENGG